MGLRKKNLSIIATLGIILMNVVYEIQVFYIQARRYLLVFKRKKRYVNVATIFDKCMYIRYRDRRKKKMHASHVHEILALSLLLLLCTNIVRFLSLSPRVRNDFRVRRRRARVRKSLSRSAHKACRAKIGESELYYIELLAKYILHVCANIFFLH